MEIPKDNSPDRASPAGPAADRVISDTSREAAGGGSLIFAARILALGLNFLFRLLATNLLGAAAYGVAALGLSLATVGAKFGTAGFDRVVLRFGAEYHGKKDRDGVRAIVLRSTLIGGLLCSLTGLGGFVFADDIGTYYDIEGLADVLRVFSVALPLYALMTISAASLQAMRRMKHFALWGVVGSISVACVSFPLLFWFGPWAGDVKSVALALGLGWAFAGVGGLLAIARSLGRGPVQRSMTSRQYVFAGTMVLFVGAGQLQQYIDRLMLGVLATATDVGIYDVAVGLTATASLFLMAFNTIAFPMMGSLYHADRIEEMGSLYRTVTRWVMTLSILPVLVMLCLPEQILGFFGDDFVVGGTVLCVLALAQLANAAAGPVGGLLMMTNHEKWVLINTVVMGSLNALGNYLLVPKLGILGAGISTGCALVLWNLAAVIEVYWLYGIRAFSLRYAKVLLIGLGVMGGARALAAYGGDWGGWLGLVAGLAAFLGYLGYQGLSPEDEPVYNAVAAKLRRLRG